MTHSHPSDPEYHYEDREDEDDDHYDYGQFDPRLRHKDMDPETREQFDITREILTEGDPPFPVDRKKLRIIVRDVMGSEPDEVKFLSAGTFHKAFLVTLKDGREVVARVARRFMPRLKTESEVATLNYIRTKTNVPVPTIYNFNANPYNSLGGEYIIMSKAPGIPLVKVYNRLPAPILQTLFQNLAQHVNTLFNHRFSSIGSLYPSSTSSKSNPTFQVGPIVSWPFFGEGRGEQDLNRGPWSSMTAYLRACADREIDSVKNEAEGTIKGHRPHLPPRNPDDESSGSEQESSDSDEDEAMMYRDYRSRQRSSLLVAHAIARTNSVRKEMERFLTHMRKIGVGKSGEKEEFSFDLHDLSLANIFVDPDEPSKITCIIDWESTTIRPLWQCAHMPSFIHSHHTQSHQSRSRATSVPQVALASTTNPFSVTSPTHSGVPAHLLPHFHARPTPTTHNSYSLTGAMTPVMTHSISEYGKEGDGTTTPHATSPTTAMFPSNPLGNTSRTSSGIINGNLRPAFPGAYTSSSSTAPITIPRHLRKNTRADSYTNSPATHESGVPGSYSPSSFSPFPHAHSLALHHNQHYIPRPDPPTLFRQCMSSLNEDWVRLEKEAAEARRVHKVVEWDGWEEGLVASVIGEPEQDEQEDSGATSLGGLLVGDLGVGVGGYAGVGVGMGGFGGGRYVGVGRGTIGGVGAGGFIPLGLGAG